MDEYELLDRALDKEDETEMSEEGSNQSSQEDMGEPDPAHVSIMSNRKKAFAWVVSVVLCLLVLIILVSFALGVLVGKFLLAGAGGEEGGVSHWGNTVADGMSAGDWIRDTLAADNIMNNLSCHNSGIRTFPDPPFPRGSGSVRLHVDRQLTSKPHIAGKDQNKLLADNIYNQWRQFRFDKVELRDYNVLLSYVNRSNYNRVQLHSSTNEVLYEAETQQEPPLTDGEDDPNVPPPFNAYSGVGKASGPLVYVNYATIDDFLYITINLSINITGRVCIARYGNIFRGNKAELAQRFGCSGLIIYSDPSDYAPKGGLPVYPDGPSLPPGGVQRGSLLISDGDALTPGLPSIDGVVRRLYDDVIADKVVPSIPVQPISYGDAYWFMSQLNSHPVPKSWAGELNITYNILQDGSNTNVTHIEVNNVQERKDIYNVVGVIYGAVEPDHLVILGNHRDAWTFGGADPSSGTAMLMEMARVLNTMRDNDWRPGRTIVLCSWDAEEYGLIGSSEWVEDILKLLGANTVAYLNVDIAVEGNFVFRASASPLLYDVIYRVTRATNCPCSNFDSVYDQWKSYYPDNDRPLISSLGSGSDYTAFIQSIGVSSADIQYIYQPANFSYYSVYHSVHDNFFWMSHFGDPGFTHHAAVGEVWLAVAMEIATTPVLPYNVVDYATTVTKLYNSLKESYEIALLSHNISLSLLNRALNDFIVACEKFQADVESFQNGNSSDNLNMLRIINNKLVNLERAFIIAEGLPGRPYYKHVIFAPSSINSYADSSFPGVVDSIFDAQTDADWYLVHRQLDFVAVHLRYATQILNQQGMDWISMDSS